MTIVDRHYGGEIITSKGKIFKFDSVDCLIKYNQNNQDDGSRKYIIDFSRPGTFIRAEDTYFAYLESRSSPMGTKYAAFGTVEEASKINPGSPGPVVRWESLIQALK